MTREWRKLHKQEFHYLYCSPYFVLVVKSRRMRGAGQEGKVKCLQDFGGKHQEMKPLGRATLKYTFYLLISTNLTH